MGGEVFESGLHGFGSAPGLSVLPGFLQGSDLVSSLSVLFDLNFIL